MPKVSVLMPVYNGEKYLAQAIDSVLAQSFTDFELIVVDDGSNDGSAGIVASYVDGRVRYVKNETNMGLVFTRNRAISAAQGEYLAWLDADDLSHPQRLQKQVDLLDADKLLGLCGAWVQTLGLGRNEVVWRYPVTSNAIKSCMLFENPIATSSVMMRRTSLPEQELRFDSEFPVAEDYELWERISRVSTLRNIPEVLVRYRIHPEQTTNVGHDTLFRLVRQIQCRQLALLHLPMSEWDEATHAVVSTGGGRAVDKEEINRAEAWLLRLASLNDVIKTYPLHEFQQAIARRWYKASAIAARDGFISCWKWGRSPLASWDVRYWRHLGQLAKAQGRSILKRAQSALC